MSGDVVASIPIEPFPVVHVLLMLLIVRSSPLPVWILTRMFDVVIILLLEMMCAVLVSINVLLMSTVVLVDLPLDLHQQIGVVVFYLMYLLPNRLIGSSVLFVYMTAVCVASSCN